MSTSVKNQSSQAKDQAGQAADKAKEAAGHAGEAISHAATAAGQAVGQTAESATAAVGSGMQNLAGTVRDNTPNSGMLGTASDRAADALEGAGRYLEDRGLSGIADDMAGLIDNPDVAKFCFACGSPLVSAAPPQEFRKT